MWLNGVLVMCCLAGVGHEHVEHGHEHARLAQPHALPCKCSIASQALPRYLLHVAISVAQTLPCSALRGLLVLSSRSVADSS